MTLCGQSAVPVAASEKSSEPDVQDLFAKKLQELGEECGYMSVGSTSIETGMSDSYLSLKEDADAGEEGILLAKVFDFDGDGAPELLVIRRQRGYGNVNYGGFVNAADRHDYLFEMYEADDGLCRMSARMAVGVFDVPFIFMSRASASFLLHETEDGTDILMETVFSGQDHPEDIALACFRYKKGYFNNPKGLRYGNVFCGENSLLCLVPESLDAYGYLSASGPESNHWSAVAKTESYEDEVFKAAFAEGLGKLGLTLIQTRHDIQTSKENSSESEQADTDAYYSVTAKDCYAASKGNLELMAYIETHQDTSSLGSGKVTWKSNRSIFTDQDLGMNRDTATE